LPYIVDILLYLPGDNLRPH